MDFDWLKNIKIQNKFFIAFGIPTVLLAILVVFVIISNNNAESFMFNINAYRDILADDVYRSAAEQLKLLENELAVVLNELAPLLGEPSLQIEDFDFEDAFVTLGELKKNWESA